MDKYDEQLYLEWSGRICSSEVRCSNREPRHQKGGHWLNPRICWLWSFDATWQRFCCRVEHVALQYPLPIACCSGGSPSCYLGRTNRPVDWSFWTWRGYWLPPCILVPLQNKEPDCYCSWCHTGHTWCRWPRSLWNLRSNHMDLVCRRFRPTLCSELTERPLFQGLDLFMIGPFLGQHNVPYQQDELWLWLNLEERTVSQLRVRLFENSIIKGRWWIVVRLLF